MGITKNPNSWDKALFFCVFKIFFLIVLKRVVWYNNLIKLFKVITMSSIVKFQEGLPTDLFGTIGGFLSDKDRAYASGVCKHWRNSLIQADPVYIREFFELVGKSPSRTLSWAGKQVERIWSLKMPLGNEQLKLLKQEIIHLIQQEVETILELRSEKERKLIYESSDKELLDIVDKISERKAANLEYFFDWVVKTLQTTQFDDAITASAITLKNTLDRMKNSPIKRAIKIRSWLIQFGQHLRLDINSFPHFGRFPIPVEGNLITELKGTRTILSHANKIKDCEVIQGIFQSGKATWNDLDFVEKNFTGRQLQAALSGLVGLFAENPDLLRKYPSPELQRLFSSVIEHCTAWVIQTFMNSLLQSDRIKDIPLRIWKNSCETLLSSNILARIPSNSLVPCPKGKEEQAINQRYQNIITILQTTLKLAGLEINVPLPKMQIAKAIAFRESDAWASSKIASFITMLTALASSLDRSEVWKLKILKGTISALCGSLFIRHIKKEKSSIPDGSGISMYSGLLSSFQILSFVSSIAFTLEKKENVISFKEYARAVAGAAVAQVAIRCIGSLYGLWKAYRGQV